jgi:NADH-quinone oxidoreductase subunit N
VNLHELVSQLIIDTRGSTGDGLFSWPTPDSSLGVFLPEITLCGTIVLMLIARIFRLGRGLDSFGIAFLGSAFALYLTAPWLHLGIDPSASLATSPDSAYRMEIFTGMLVYDPFTVFMRAVLIGFAVLFVIFTQLSGIPDNDDRADIYTLVLGSTLGMCMMAAANHLMMVFLAFEMASVPSYALAGLLKGRRLGSEAALKFSVYGAGAAGVMLYGISLIAGVLNTAHLPTMAVRLAEKLPQFQQSASSELMVLALGGLMIAVGLAFKLSAVPFHFWCPDVFEGACAEVNAFLSVASKAAALALLVRVALGFGALPVEGVQPGARSLATTGGLEPGLANAASLPAASSPAAPSTSGLFAVADEAAAQPAASHAPSTPETAPPAGNSAASVVRNLEPARAFMGKLIAFLAILTCTFGNLAAYGQSNIKRLLAYSTIAHAGYMMMAVPALLVMVPYKPGAAQGAVSALAIYIVVYLFMNLGAFAIVAFLRNAMRSEAIADYAGLIRYCPLTVICLSVILFSLVGLPPLAGFIGKFAIFSALVDGYRLSSAAGSPATYLLVLLIVGGVNTAISLFYYLRIVKVMTMDEDPADRRPFTFSAISLQSVFVCLVTAPTLLLMLNWEGLSRWATAAARYLLVS